MSQYGNALNLQTDGIIKRNIGAFSAISVTNHSVLVGAASNGITSLAVASTGQVLQGNTGADPSFSTATFPSTATGTGTILRANGTNWVATTATYPTTTTSQQILYSTANNVIGELTTANSKLPATNSSGTLAMRAFSVVTQVFTSNGTYTPTSGMLYCIIECVGGGGGGGGAQATGAATVSGGSGGGAGEYARGTFSAATIGASQTVTIGAAGAANSNAAGGNGGNTSVGSTVISANGGTGGSIATASVVYNGVAVLGGTGGTGGDFRTPGDQGQYSFGNANATVSLMNGGAGGSSKYGAGGMTSAANAAGIAALGYGSGGSGALNFTSQSARAGGAGTAGIVIVTEYVIA